MLTLRILAACGFISVLCSSSFVFGEEFKTIPGHVVEFGLLENYEYGFNITPIPEARSINEITVKMIQDWESWESSPYNDSSDYCTIGYGHLIALRPCSTRLVDAFYSENRDLFVNPRTLSRQGGEILFERDTRHARSTVQRKLAMLKMELDNDKFGALVSLTFNIGSQAFNGSTLVERIKVNRLDLVPREIMKWVNSKKQRVAGLVNRRSCERLLFEGNLKLQGNKFNRKICQDVYNIAPNAEAIDIGIGE